MDHPTPYQALAQFVQALHDLRHQRQTQIAHLQTCYQSKLPGYQYEPINGPDKFKGHKAYLEFQTQVQLPSHPYPFCPNYFLFLLKENPRFSYHEKLWILQNIDTWPRDRSKAFAFKLEKYLNLKLTQLRVMLNYIERTSNPHYRSDKQKKGPDLFSPGFFQPDFIQQQFEAYQVQEKRLKKEWQRLELECFFHLN